MIERLRVEYAALTDVGRKRSHNEDAFLCAEDDGLFLVADGMGGHSAGEVASAMAVELVTQFYAAACRDPVAHWPFKQSRDEQFQADTLNIAIQYANLRIFESARENSERRGMGTTLVGALFAHNAAWVAHVGDSRAYIVRAAGSIEAITIDHSLLEEYRRTRPDLTEEQLKKFPYKNVITRALGMKADVSVEMHRHEMHAGDVLVICCDGLTGMIRDDEIASIVREYPDLNEACRELVHAANGNGGIDNITVVLVRTY